MPEAELKKEKEEAQVETEGETVPIEQEEEKVFEGREGDEE